MSSAPFDPVAYKRTTTGQWQTAAEPWHRWGATLEAWLGEATEALLDMAGVSGGARVLDDGRLGAVVRARRTPVGDAVSAALLPELEP